MGAIPAFCYMCLMIFAYGSQSWKLKKEGKSGTVSLNFYLFGLIGVSLRVSTTGFVIWETGNFSAICLGIAELSVLTGITTVLIQLLYYRKKERMENNEKIQTT